MRGCRHERHREQHRQQRGGTAHDRLEAQGAVFGLLGAVPCFLLRDDVGAGIRQRRLVAAFADRLDESASGETTDGSKVTAARFISRLTDASVTPALPASAFLHVGLAARAGHPVHVQRHLFSCGHECSLPIIPYGV